MQLATYRAVDELVQNAAREFGSDRRKSRRYPFFRSLAIDIDGTKLTAFSRDISSTCIGLLHDRSIQTSFATLTVPTTQGEIDLTTKVQFCKPISDGWFRSVARFCEPSIWRVTSLLMAIVTSEIHCRFMRRYPFFSAGKITSQGTGGSVISCFTKDISPEGIGLLHIQPLPLQRIRLELPRATGSPEMQTDIKWCKQCNQDWYISGGQFATLSLTELSDRSF